MTTIQGSNGRRYEVRHRLYGTSNNVYDLYFGGVFLATTASAGPHGESSTTIEVAVDRANVRADLLGLKIEE